jgi:choline dehydrogenase-like flavoprotein
MLSKGVRYANEVVMEGAGTKEVIEGAWPPGSTHHKNKTNEDWHEHVKKYASTSYHLGGTCKLAQDDDPVGVVDKYLRFCGDEGLRVVDCSIMKTFMSGHTQKPAYGMAEKAAEFIMKQNGHTSAGKNRSTPGTQRGARL